MENTENAQLEAAFDYDIFASRTSRNETNHFHIYVDDDGDYQVTDGNFVGDNLSAKEYGSLIHEYIHYIQHIQTLYGVNRTRMNNRLFIEYRKFLRKQKKIEMPLLCNIVSPLSLDLFAKANDLQGFQNYSHNIDEVEIKRVDIELARKNNQSVRIGVYDFSSGDALDGEDGYHFGYWAIIEGMAHHIQLLIDITAEERHSSVPYKIVDRICQAIYPEIYNDKLLMISICMIALSYSNPGVGFFDVADYASTNKINNGKILYKDSLLNKVIFKGKQISQKEMLRIEQDELLKELKMITGVKPVYYKRVFDQTNKELSTGESTLLNIIYDGSIKDVKTFNDVLLRRYGFPFIESHQSSLLQNNIETNKPYAEIALLASWELLYKRLANNCSTMCNRYEMCKSSDKFSIECRDAQWLKKEKCLLSQGFLLFASNVKVWDQKNGIKRM